MTLSYLILGFVSNNNKHGSMSLLNTAFNKSPNSFIQFFAHHFEEVVGFQLQSIQLIIWFWLIKWRVYRNMLYTVEKHMGHTWDLGRQYRQNVKFQWYFRVVPEQYRILQPKIKLLNLYSAP